MDVFEEEKQSTHLTCKKNEAWLTQLNCIKKEIEVKNNNFVAGGEESNQIAQLE